VHRQASMNGPTGPFTFPISIGITSGVSVSPFLDSAILLVYFCTGSADGTDGSGLVKLNRHKDKEQADETDTVDEQKGSSEAECNRAIACPEAAIQSEAK
jgi:hypothetical protein